MGTNRNGKYMKFPSEHMKALFYYEGVQNCIVIYLFFFTENLRKQLPKLQLTTQTAAGILTWKKIILEQSVIKINLYSILQKITIVVSKYMPQNHLVNFCNQQLSILSPQLLSNTLYFITADQNLKTLRSYNKLISIHKSLST